MLALGCGSSVMLHLGLVAGISYWWRSPAAIDEPIEITLVEPTEIEPVTVAPSPPSVKSPKISITPIPVQVTQPKPTVFKSGSKPIVVTPAPKSVAVVVKPISKPIGSTAQSKPGSLSIKTKVKSNPRPIQTAKVNLPINPKPRSNPFSIEPKIPTPNPVQTSTIDPLIATKPPPKSVQSQREIKTTPNPPDNPITPATTSDLSSPMSPKAQERSTTSTQSPTGGNIPNNDDKTILNRDRSPGGGLTGNGGSAQSGSLQTPNSSSPGFGNGDRVGNSLPGGDSSFSTSQTGGGGGLQCVQHCEIPKLRDLQDRDGGKDRLRIRIVVDPNGLVLAAMISKSSGNPQIDAIVLEGIKQMQFKPSGKIIKGIIKANILL